MYKSINFVENIGLNRWPTFDKVCLFVPKQATEDNPVLFCLFQ